MTVSIEGSRAFARTDATGRFLINRAPSGRHVLIVDGHSADHGHEQHGVFETQVTLNRSTTTVLSYTIWMTPLDASGDKRVRSPTTGETIVTNPRIPGLEVRIPKASIIRDADGRTVRDLNLTAIAVDRPPFPLPSHITVPLYFTAQPGRAYLSKGAQIIYPNYNHQPAGARVDFWNYDARDRGWYIYGRGTVTADAKQVVPDPGVRVWEFTGAMISSSPTPPDNGPTAGGGTLGGDPVDMATGLFVYEKTDLKLADTLPIALTRTYRPNDTNSYAFGVGTNHPYDVRLWSVHNFQDVDLILPDGGRVHYVRISPGHSYTDAIYEAANAPGRYYKSTVRWNGNSGWDLKLRDGTVWVFPQYGSLAAIRDRYGNQITVSRASGGTGNITQITSPHGRWVQFTYDTSNRITRIRDNGGRTASYAYDASGHLWTATDIDGGTSSYYYDTAGRMTSINDARGITYITNSYDNAGRVTEQTMADGGTHQFDYQTDATGKITKTTLTDPRDFQREVTFSASSYPVKDVLAAGSAEEEATTYERAPTTNQIISKTDELGRKTTYDYNAQGELLKITRLADTAHAAATTYTREPTFGQVTSLTDAEGHTSSYAYDARGQLISAKDATDRETTFAYANNDGVPTSVTDPAGKSTRYTYEAGDLIAKRDPAGNETVYATDAVGRVVAMIDELGRRTRYTHDNAGHVVRVTDPLGHATRFEHDANGNLTKVTDARGNITRLTYDDMDRVASWTDGLGGTERRAYDQSGNVTRVTDREGQITDFRYDVLDRRIFAGYGRIGDDESPTYDETIDYEYDDAGRLTTAGDSKTGTLTNGYDELDNLASQAGPQRTVTYTHDAAGRRTSMTVAGQPTVTYGHDAAGRLTGVTRSGTQVSLSYDAAGRLATTTLPDGITQARTYDDASNLTTIAYSRLGASVGDINYAYDARGQRTATWGTMARTGIPQPLGAATYDAANRRTSQDGAALSYDDNGNLTNDGSSSYGWSARGLLTRVSHGGDNTDFAYDASERRTQKTTSAGTTSYVYDGANVATELVDGTPSASLIAGLAVDQIFGRATPNGVKSLLTDALGSTIALADASGTVQTSYTYEPFGAATRTGQTDDNPTQYTGRENDGTGLLYYRARYYSPAMHRFISEDPARYDGGGPNFYSYVAGDPVNLTDPSGLMPASDPSPGPCGPGRKNGGDAQCGYSGVGPESPPVPHPPHSGGGSGPCGGTVMGVIWNPLLSAPGCSGGDGGGESGPEEGGDSPVIPTPDVSPGGPQHPIPVTPRPTPLPIRPPIPLPIP